MRYQQVFFIIDESFSGIIGRRKCLREIDSVFWTGFLAQSAEDTAQHIDLVFCGIFFFAVEMFFSRQPFSAFHGDGFGWAGKSTEPAGCTSLSSLFIAIQYMQSAEHL